MGYLVTQVRIPSVDLRTKLHRDIRNFCDAVRMREGQEELGEPVTAEVGVTDCVLKSRL